MTVTASKPFEGEPRTVYSFGVLMLGTLQTPMLMAPAMVKVVGAAGPVFTPPPDVASRMQEWAKQGGFLTTAHWAQPPASLIAVMMLTSEPLAESDAV